MSHELEEFIDQLTGEKVAAFVSANKPAWHALGTVVDGTLTAAEALQTAYLGGWDVRREGLQAVVTVHDDTLGDVHHVLDVPDNFAIVRNHPLTKAPDVLGVVGSRYEPIQNEAAFAFCDTLIADAGGAHFETAGSLRGGKTVFLTVQFPHLQFTLDQHGRADQVDMYLAVCNNHVGERSLEAMVTPVRVVCANTERAARRAAVSHFKIRHTASAQEHIAEAHRALGMTARYQQEFVADAERMIHTDITLTRFVGVVDQLWELPKDASDAQKKAADTRKTHLVDIYQHSKTQTTITGTAWGGFNAVTQYLDWDRPVRGKNDTMRALNRASAVLLSDELSSIKSRAFDLFATVPA